MAFGRDQYIRERVLLLRAFVKAKVHMFLFPGDAARDYIIELVRLHLARICALALPCGSTRCSSGLGLSAPVRVVSHDDL